MSIHPEVTEFCYSGSGSSVPEDWGETESRGTSEAGIGFGSEEEEEDIPSPVYPYDSWTRGGQMMTQL